MRIEIKNLKRYGKGDEIRIINRLTKEFEFSYPAKGGWKWEVEVTDEDLNYRHTSEYRTDKDGFGLWEDDKQILGTCQYQAYKTYPAQMRKILKSYDRKWL